MRFPETKGVLLIVGVALMVTFLVMPAMAGLRDRASEAVDSVEGAEAVEESTAEADGYLDDLALGDIVQVEGNDVWIRLTPGQYRTCKGVSRVKRRGRVRVVLRPRQIRALNEALGSNVGVTDLVLDENAVDLRRKRLPRERVESHYLVEPVSEFR